MVFFAGLPGTGKSLLVHQLAHVALGQGRRVHLLQWDVARPVFEASRAGQRYPLAGGVTHAVIRRAAGLWVRRAVVDWSARFPGDLLVGETPFVGNPTAHSYYVEGKYSFPAGLYLAARWDELRYTKVQGTTGPARPWDDDVRRFEGGVGYRIHKNLLAKAAYQSITLDSKVGANSDRRFDILAASAVVTF